MCTIFFDPDGEFFVGCLKHFVQRHRESKGDLDNSYDDEIVENQLKEMLFDLWKDNNQTAPYLVVGDGYFALKHRNYITIDNGTHFTELGMEIINAIKNKGKE